MPKGPPVIGIVGGVASGKSTVARLFSELGAAVVDADQIGHDVLQTHAVRDELVRRWGDCILAADGTVDRQKVADIVFDDPRRLEELNRIIHPRIRRRMREQIGRARRAGQHRLIALDAALLLEGGLQDWCDAVVFVDARPAVREERVERHRAWTSAELARREANQMPLAEKREQADCIVDNGGTLADTTQRVKALFRRWARA